VVASVDDKRFEFCRDTDGAEEVLAWLLDPAKDQIFVISGFFV
jgi:hypothetical protein